MKTPVIITKKEGANSVFTPNPKPGKDGESYGFIRVEQSVIESKINAKTNSAFTAVKLRSALAPFKSSDFNKVSAFLKEGTQLEGHIVRKEQLEPRFEGDQHKQVPIFDAERKPVLNEDGTPKMRDVLHNGQKIWSKDIYTTDMNEQDVLMTPYDVYTPSEEELKSTAKVAEGKGKAIA